MPLLSTKLHIPPARPGLVARPRLMERLDVGLCGKLTLISAPAGFGKTTLLSAWIERRMSAAAGEPAVAWLSLDEQDNDPARFLAYLVAALQALRAGLGEAALAALQAPQPPPSGAMLTILINEVAALPAPRDSGERPYILVLDDYHLITTQAIHDGLAFLLDHLPPNLHLVIATRADPPLPVARLRGQGQLAELRQADLRFSTDEAAAFLNTRLGLHLAAEEIAALQARTEGWIAGLQMASLVLQGQPRHGRQDASGFIHALTGSDRYILDYLVEEVLQRQAESVQAFLLQTCILDRLSGPLCDAILQDREPADRLVGPEARPPAGSQGVLDYLERNNLFVVPLDHERRWYRYYRLFADLLRQRLQRAHPGLEPMLHGLASAWCERNGLLGEAIDHALAAKDWERATRLVEQAAEATLMRSEVATLLGWVDALPDEAVRARPTLCVYQAWALLLAGRPLNAVESLLGEAARGDAAHQAAPVRALLALYSDEMPRAVELARQALEQLPEDSLFLRNLATWVLGLSHVLQGDLDSGAHTLDQVAATSHRSGDVMMAVMVLCHIAELRMSQGKLYQARDTYHQALEWAADEQARPLPIASAALWGLGELSYQWNDLAAAARYLTQGLELAAGWGEVGAMDGYLSLAHVRQAEGDPEGAQEALNRARRVALRTDLTDSDDVLVAAQQAQLWLARGDLAAAVRWLEERGLTVETALAELRTRVGDSFYRSRRRRTVEYATLARALLAQGRPAEALAVLEPLLAIAERWGMSERVIRFQVLAALAFYAQDDLARALAALERALALAEPGGYVRLFLDEGQPMARLLYRAAERGIAPAYTGRLLAAFPTTEPLPAPSQAQLVEPLSERELDVLRLIAEGLSNQEIAQRLFISLRTVKWHSGNIYGKLGVQSRTQAVAKARSMGLLPHSPPSS